MRKWRRPLLLTCNLGKPEERGARTPTLARPRTSRAGHLFVVVSSNTLLAPAAEIVPDGGGVTSTDQNGGPAADPCTFYALSYTQPRCYGP
jgi:hypothetical protein